MKKWLRKNMPKAGLYLLYIVISVFFLYPVVWVVSLSFKTVPELFKLPPTLLPEQINLDNYVHVIQNTRILKNIWNTIYIVFFSVLGTLIITLPATYAFSRLRFRLKNGVMFAILMFQMISPLVIAIPLYIYFSKLAIINSHMALILVYIVISSPFAAWFLRGYFDTVPKELDEAATIDGCGRFQILTRILIPVTMPGIISITLLTTVSCWSQFVIPFILLSNGEKFPISVGLNNLQSTSEAITTHYLAAACVLGILPTVVLYTVFQRFIVSAMTDGAVKG